MFESWSQQTRLILCQKAVERGIALGGHLTGIYVDGRHVWLYETTGYDGMTVRLIVDVEPLDLAEYVGEEHRQQLLHLSFAPTNRGPRGDITPPEWRSQQQNAVA